MGVGREYVCVGASVLQEAADYSSLCYIWRGWIPPKTFVENWFWVPFITWVLCVTVHSLCIQGSYELCILKVPRTFHWEMHLNLRLSAVHNFLPWWYGCLWQRFSAIELNHQSCKQTMLTLTIANTLPVYPNCSLPKLLLKDRAHERLLWNKIFISIFWEYVTKTEERRRKSIIQNLTQKSVKNLYFIHWILYFVVVNKSHEKIKTSGVLVRLSILSDFGSRLWLSAQSPCVSTEGVNL